VRLAMDPGTHVLLNPTLTQTLWYSSSDHLCPAKASSSTSPRMLTRSGGLTAAPSDPSGSSPGGCRSAGRVASLPPPPKATAQRATTRSRRRHATLVRGRCSLWLEIARLWGVASSPASACNDVCETRQDMGV